MQVKYTDHRHLFAFYLHLFYRHQFAFYQNYHARMDQTWDVYNHRLLCMLEMNHNDAVEYQQKCFK